MTFNSQNELVINYEEQTVAVSEKSDQGPACVNTVEAVYLVSVILAIVTGIGIVRDIFFDFFTIFVFFEEYKMNKTSFFNLFIEGKETYHCRSRTLGKP